VPSKKKAVPQVEVHLDPSQASFTIPQVAKYSGLTPWQVRMSVWQGKLPAKRVGKCLIILRDDVDAFLKALPNITLNTSEWLAKRNRGSVVVRSNGGSR
jgi:excisionase family DNA binding protein